MAKLFKYKNNDPIEVNSWEEVQKYCAERHSVQPYQVVARWTNATDKYVIDATADVIMQVNLTNKMGESFASVGFINFEL